MSSPRMETGELLDRYVEGWHRPPKRTLAVQFLVADLIEFYMRTADRDPGPMLETARAMADANLKTR